MNAPMPNHQDILKFWFVETTPEQQFKKDAAFDALIHERFSETHRAAAHGELYEWRATPEGRLAEIIVLDQFSRNLYRDRPEAFVCDGMALVLAQEAVGLGADQVLLPDHRVFMYMPYMHSESRAIHVVAEHLFRQPGVDANLKYELRHKAIIDRFGRFPHRNAILGRESSPEERKFLEQTDSSF
ncbi:MAG: DUF924 family protein [Gammaproteobacteria bacterium]